MTFRHSHMIRVEVFFSLVYMIFGLITDRQTLSIMYIDITLIHSVKSLLIIHRQRSWSIRYGHGPHCRIELDWVDSTFIMERCLEEVHLLKQLSRVKWLSFTKISYHSYAFDDIRLNCNVFLLYRDTYRDLNTTNKLIISTRLYTSFTDSSKCSKLRNEWDLWIFNLVLGELSYVVKQTSFYFVEIKFSHELVLSEFYGIVHQVQWCFCYSWFLFFVFILI